MCVLSRKFAKETKLGYGVMHKKLKHIICTNKAIGKYIAKHVFFKSSNVKMELLL